MSLNIDFDHNWSYSQRTTTNDDDYVSVVNNSNWLPIDLPHIITREKENNHWYRKQFQLIQADQQFNQTILLTFKSTDSINPVVSILVWFNTVKLFSESIKSSQISIELQMKNPNQTHTLIVCCINHCLSFNAFLTVPLNTTCIIREVSCNPANNLNQKRNGIHDYNGLTNGIETTMKDLVVPYLNIVMLIVGTRGDVQPFIAYGKALRAVGHRVRLATHEKFRKFVREHGLEFFPLSGDPTEIMSFMVENNGIIPSITEVFQNDLFQKRRVFFDILHSSWLACISDDDETGAPFRAEAIIANPLSYEYVHCAQKLGIPLHMAFTMPSSPTGAFPHPLSAISYSKTPKERLNIFSYSMVEAVMWAGIGDLINEFRQDVLGLPTLHVGQAVSVLIDEKVPFTYCWSPSLVSKPLDWPSYIDVSGYFFLDLAKDYVESNDELLRFLGLSPTSNDRTREISPPIFIGFGSITGHDSRRLLKLVLEALDQTGYRAILSGFDVNANDLPETVFTIDDIPYDWLFQHVSAVCHHGGAGTTAAGLLAGKPTITVPFFGDQFFWAHIVEKSGAGPPPIPGKDITVDKLVKAFTFVHQPVVQKAAKRVQEMISHENGCATAVRSFHANLPLSRMRSDLESTFPACFRLDEFDLQVSRPVAQVLLSTGVVDESQFKYHFTKLWRSGQDSTGEMSTSVRPTTADFQLDATKTKPSVFSNFKNDANNVINQSRNDSHPSSPYTSRSPTTSNSNRSKDVNAKQSFSRNVDVTEQMTIHTDQGASSPLLKDMDDLQKYDSHDISRILCHAANISGYSPETCKHILVEFLRIKRQHQHMQSFFLTDEHQSPISTIRRSQLFTNLLALFGVLFDVTCGLSAVLLDMSIYDKIPPPSNRYKILSWLLSRWF